MRREGSDWETMRSRIIGLGDESSRKSYYPELQKKIAELEQAREQIRVSETNLRTVFDSVHDAVFIHDLEGRVLEANATVSTLFEVPPERVAEFRIADYSADPVEILTLTTLWERTYRDGSLVFPWQCRRPLTGEAFDVEVALRPVRWYEREAVVAVVRDSTERKRFERKMLEAQRMEAIGQLAGGVAHDFNNLLTGIMGFAHLLQTSKLSPADQSSVAMILDTATRAGELTRSLLDFSRQGKKETCPVDVHAVLRASMALLERALDGTVRVEVHYGPSATVWGDPAQLQNAFLNLGLNARDAMPQGGLLRVTTETIALAEPGAPPFSLSPGPFVRLSFADTGTGIAPDVVERIFEPFFTTKPPGKGTGLGLASVYGTVRDHGGSIEVDTEPGQGTSFHLLLPLRDVSPQP